MSKAALAAILPPGPVRPKLKLVGRKQFPAIAGGDRLVLVCYRGFLMPVKFAADALDIHWHTLRKWSWVDPDITERADALMASRARALEIRKAARALGMTPDSVRARVSKGMPNALVRPRARYKLRNLHARARELALDSPFDAKLIAMRLLRGWPEDRAKSAPYRKYGPDSRRASVRALAESLHKDADPSLTVQVIMRRLHAGWSAEEARIIPKGQR